MPEVGLSLTLWERRFEASDNLWLRWRNQQCDLILTGHEWAIQAEDRAARLAAKLSELGAEPEQV
jgi:hypothetical protein